MAKKLAAVLLCVVLIFVGVLALGLLQMVLFYKCPHCGAQLEPRGPVPKFCPNCGKELD